jgi:hypothetical protein
VGYVNDGVSSRGRLGSYVLRCCGEYPATQKTITWKLQISRDVLSTTVAKQNRDSSVGIALGYGLDGRVSRVRFPVGAGNFSLHHRVQNGSGAHPASYPMGTRGSFLGVKRPRREADHSPPSSAEVKNAWSYTSTPQYAFMAWCSVKKRYRDNFTFIFTFTVAKQREMRREDKARWTQIIMCFEVFVRKLLA